MTREEMEQKLQQTTKSIVERFKPDKIILFGSWAWGIPGPDSDVDLLIVKKTEDTRKEAREIDGSIFPRPFPIDLLVYSPAQIESGLRSKDFFIRHIFENGRILYG